MLARWKGRQAAAGMTEVRPREGPKEESVMNNWGESEVMNLQRQGVCFLHPHFSINRYSLVNRYLIKWHGT